MFDMQKIGKKIVALRREKNMTQTELADRLNVSFQAVSNWERGQSMPDISKLPELAEIFEVSIDALLGARSRFVESVSEGKMEEYLESAEASPEEIAEAMPILPPNQVDAVMDKKDTFDFEDISVFLPYMSEEDVAEIAVEMAKEGKDVEKFLPHMYEDDVAKLAMRAAEQGNSVDKFLPHMDEDDVFKMAEKLFQRGENIDNYLPHMYMEDIGTLAEKAQEMGRPVDKFLPHMDEDDVFKMAEKLFQRGENIDNYLPHMYTEDVGALAEKAQEMGRPIEKFLPFMCEDDVGKVVKTYLQRRKIKKK